MIASTLSSELRITADSSVDKSRVQIEPMCHDEWLELSSHFKDHNYRQSWEYGRLLAKRRNAESHHVKIHRDGKALGMADVRIKRAPLLGGIAYVSGGPLTRKGSGEDIDDLGCCLGALYTRYVRTEGLILRIQGTLGDSEWNARSAARFLEVGFSTCSSGEYRTVLVDLRPTLAQIRAALSQKWRNCLNKAERFNPTPVVSRRVEDFERFASLFKSFVSRKGFTVDLGPDFYSAVQNHSAPSESLTLLTIETEGRLIAGHMSSMLGDTCVYLLGATSEEALKSNAAYLLQWEVIKLARERGLRWYDLGGIDPEANPGVYHFKQGMGGIEVHAPGPFEMVPNGLRGRVITGAEAAYRWIRRRTRPTKRDLI